jgi:hypothetical protein
LSLPRVPRTIGREVESLGTGKLPRCGRAHGPNAQRRRNSELARPIRRDAVTWAGPVVVDDFPQEIPITRRELDVIETYLGALLDEALGVPE